MPSTSQSKGNRKGGKQKQTTSRTSRNKGKQKQKQMQQQKPKPKQKPKQANEEQKQKQKQNTTGKKFPKRCGGKNCSSSSLKCINSIPPARTLPVLKMTRVACNEMIQCTTVDIKWDGLLTNTSQDLSNSPGASYSGCLEKQEVVYTSGGRMCFLPRLTTSMWMTHRRIKKSISRGQCGTVNYHPLLDL